MKISELIACLEVLLRQGDREVMMELSHGPFDSTIERVVQIEGVVERDGNIGSVVMIYGFLG